MIQNEIEKYRIAGRVAAVTRAYARSIIAENVTLLELADKIEHFIIKRGLKPAFPVNIGINNISAHYTPSSDDIGILKKGDVIKIDLGAHLEGYIADTAITIEVGTDNYSKLIDASAEALNLALELLKPELEVNVIGSCIENAITARGFKPVKNLTGHSMSRYRLHGGKAIPNVRTSGTNKIKLGEVLAIEPFATNGEGKVNERGYGNIYRFVRDKEPRSKEGRVLIKYIKENFGTLPFAERWCCRVIDKPKPVLRELMRDLVITGYPILQEADNSIVTQAEHTAIVTENGCEIITK
ncbi:MAG: type II methionyl aminopeptidase [Candidatus Thermoplasmatota archaeon]